MIKIRDMKKILEIRLKIHPLYVIYASFTQKHNKLLGNKCVRAELLDKNEIALSMRANGLFLYL